MATFLETTGISHHLTQLISLANEKLFLVSPYLKINERLKLALEDQCKFKPDIRIIYGKNELQPAEQAWLRSLGGVRLSFCKNLHAKCYLNEHEVIVTSMNLYEYSQQNNFEMGLLVKKADEPELYQKIHDEVQRIIRMSEDVQVSIEIAPSKQDEPTRNVTPASPEKRPTKRDPAGGDGFCISCADPIRANPSQPLCRDCFGEWDRDDGDKHEYCHLCGNEHGATKLKPVCYPCYKANKTKFEWPSAA